LNLRPSGYEPDELPDCSTPRPKNLGHEPSICTSLPRFALIAKNVNYVRTG
jgi:hypothetical protein